MKGYAFIKYSSREEAEEAVEAMHGKPVDGRELKVNFSSGQVTEKVKKTPNPEGGSGGDQKS